MGGLYRSNIVDIDLSKPLKTEQVGMLIATKDSNANMIGVNVYDNGSAVSLTGCTVTGYFTRPDRQVVELTGGTSGNRAYVTLDANCYVYSGRFRLAIKISKADGLNMTVRIVNGFVYSSMYDGEYVPPSEPSEPAADNVFYTSDGSVFCTLDGAVLHVNGG